MTTQPKKWVFTELVKDSDDPEQLIAYAMYKADKDDRANQCRSRRMTDVRVNTELESFHDGIAYSERQLDDYRAKARRAVDQLILTVSQGVESAYEQRITDMKAAHEEELKKKWVEWGENAAVYSANLTKPHFAKRFGSWFLGWISGGVSGLLATVVTTIILVGIISLVKPGIRDTARDALKNGVDTLIPSSPISGVTNVGNVNEPKQPQ
ncbi:hypothetical protein [Serratia quinivorans]|uniref:hypothetical protein n=1 Tax=Serratia quinivorans TaxID=137545 RepID=UPI0021B83397|nr:hypothetical protein [Serratia quinivorans]